MPPHHAIRKSCHPVSQCRIKRQRYRCIPAIKLVQQAKPAALESISKRRAMIGTPGVYKAHQFMRHCHGTMQVERSLERLRRLFAGVSLSAGSRAYDIRLLIPSGERVTGCQNYQKLGKLRMRARDRPRGPCCVRYGDIVPDGTGAGMSSNQFDHARLVQRRGPAAGKFP